MPADKLISVIVPVYNVEPFLKECLDSILCQSYTNFELIAIDDGSTDESGSICDDYAIMDKRVKVLHKSNGGLSSARNAGLEIMKGDYVTFIDSDDMIMPLYLEKLVKAKEEYDADFSMCAHQSFYDLNEIVSHNTSKIRCFNGRKYVRDVFGPKVIGCYAWGKLFDAGSFKSTRFPVGYLYEDMLTIPYVAYDAEKIAYISEPLYLYRQRQGSILQSFSEKRAHEIIAIDKIVSFGLERKDYSLVWFARINEVRSWLELKSRFKKHNLDFSPVSAAYKKKVHRAVLGIILPFLR